MSARNVIDRYIKDMPMKPPNIVNKLFEDTILDENYTASTNFTSYKIKITLYSLSMYVS